MFHWQIPKYVLSIIRRYKNLELFIYLDGECSRTITVDELRERTCNLPGKQIFYSE